MLVRRLVLLFALVMGASSLAVAGSCSAGSLASYMSMGSCTIGSLTFSNFSYSATSSNTTAISASSVTVDPSGLGFLFEAPWLVSPGQSLTTDITYTVTADAGSAIASLVATMYGYGVYAGGTADVDGTLSTTSSDPSTYARAGGVVTSSTTNMTALTATLAEQIVLAGNNGQAALSYVATEWSTATVTSTPEPGSLLLLGTSLVGLGGYLRRRSGSGRRRGK